MNTEPAATPEPQQSKGQGKLARLRQQFAGMPKPKKIVVVAASALVLAFVIFAATRIFGDNPGPANPGQQARQGSGVNTDAPDQRLGDMKMGDQFSTDPVSRGKYLAKENCSGEGSKKLGSGPMRPADISVILPYGLVAGGHVTPVDHQYYLGKNQSAAPSTYDVLAPADGKLVTVEVRPRGAPGVYDVRGVISYSCTFFSYFDLANSLAADVAAKMPAGWDTANNGPMAVDIPVKQGQVIAKVGGQTLDYAVWDTTKTLKNLLVPKAYNNYEPWKINTVLPTDYYTDAVKSQLLPFYARTAAPRDGRLDYDVDGTASGNWFKSGTNGYIGFFSQSEFNSQTYADGHLSIAPDLYDPTGWVFSAGAVNHGTQYGINAPSPAPDKLSVGGAAVKYQLTQVEHYDEAGRKWLGATVPKSLALRTTGPTQGTALVQLTATRELKVEIFLGRSAAQVSGFTDAAATYTRGDESKTMVR